MRAQAGVTAPLAQAIAALDLPDDHVLIRSPDREVSAGDVRLIAQMSVMLAGVGVALCIAEPFEMLRALLSLDGRVAALLLLAPDLPAETAQIVMREAGVDRVVTERTDLPSAVTLDSLLTERGEGAPLATQWLLTTSGTTGVPKLVRHERASVFRAVKTPLRPSDADRWAMLYDPSRFAGTQVMAQALLSGACVLTPRSGMTTGETVDRLVEQGCTHISATPSLWRRLLMAPASIRLPLRQITLGGEIADDAILAALRARFPNARVTHIYASTEAGTGFAVRDGKAGFPADWLADGADIDGARLSVRDGMLWLRPPGKARSVAAHIVRDDAGFIRTGDRIMIEGGRARFAGREDTTLNVGGIKVQVEAVEEIVHAHPAVAQCRITAKPSAMMGSLLTLSVVPRAEVDTDPATLRQDIALWCKSRLPPPARPATIRIVQEIPVSIAGKTERATKS